MSTYAIKEVGKDGTSGPYTEAELVEELNRYRAEHPEDSGFGNVSVWEMTEHSTVGTEVSVFNFVSAEE